MSGSWRLRGYVVERCLGAGASGDVWSARVAATGERVALKRIKGARSPAHAEAALLTALDHAHLVRLHALADTDDATVLVLDLAQGGSLADLLRARGRLTPGEVITAVAPIGAALAYLHDEGVVHGDVSPANILFTAGGSPLLADVGVSRLTGDDRDAVSTPAYVDPSVAAGCVPGPASDVFMLGAVALHALTGAPAWPAPDGDSALAQAVAGDLGDVAARLRAAQVPPAMTAPLVKALSVDPQRRGTAADLALDLRHGAEPSAIELLAGRPVSGEPVSGEPVSGEPVSGELAPAGRRGPAVGSYSVTSRPAGPRHAAVPARPDVSALRPRRDGGRRWRGSRDAEPSVETRAGRPDFERPARVGRTPLVPPTRIVGTRPRPAVPPPRRLAYRRLPRGRALAGVLVTLVVVALAAAGTVWANVRDPGRSAQSAHRARSAALRTSVAPSHTTESTRVTTHRPGPADSRGRGPARDPSATAVPAALRALRALDRVRAGAYAARDVTLLRRVYASSALLDADVAQLQRTVPAGCGLTGAITSYTDPHVVLASASRIELTVRATLAPSRLVCSGTERAVARGAGPTLLRLDLIGTGPDLRIGAQRAV